MPRAILVLFAFSILLGSTVAVAQEKGADAQNLNVSFDPRVELLSVIFRLAGNPEYNHPRSSSSYAAEVEKPVGSFRGHPVVQSARTLRARRGVSYDAVISMAIHVEDAAGLQERVAFDRTPSSLDARWRADEARDFLEKARQFVKDTDFLKFLDWTGNSYEFITLY